MEKSKIKTIICSRQVGCILIKLFRHMKKREVTMILIACVLICGQVFFDLKIPDFIDEMTVLATSAGGDIGRT